MSGFLGTLKVSSAFLKLQRLAVDGLHCDLC